MPAPAPGRSPENDNSDKESTAVANPAKATRPSYHSREASAKRAVALGRTVLRISEISQLLDPLDRWRGPLTAEHALFRAVNPNDQVEGFCRCR